MKKDIPSLYDYCVSFILKGIQEMKWYVIVPSQITGLLCERIKEIGILPEIAYAHDHREKTKDYLLTWSFDLVAYAMYTGDDLCLTNKMLVKTVSCATENLLYNCHDCFEQWNNEIVIDKDFIEVLSEQLNAVESIW